MKGKNQIQFVLVRTALTSISCMSSRKSAARETAMNTKRWRLRLLNLGIKYSGLMASRSTHRHQSDNHSTTPIRPLCMVGPRLRRRQGCAAEGIWKMLKRMSFLPGDEPLTIALVGQAEERLFRSIQSTQTGKI